jgi:hypothetical protein
MNTDAHGWGRLRRKREGEKLRKLVWSLATAPEVAGACQSAAIKRSLMFNLSTNKHEPVGEG